jgi:hypothetical protein
MRRRSLNRIGILAIAMLIALGAVGVAYSAWVDDIEISGSLSTSPVDDGLHCGACSPDSGESYITCATSADEMELTISVINPQPDVNYCCDFAFSNAANSWPVRIIGMDLSNPYSDSGVSVAFNNLTGMVINPGNSAPGKVHISLDADEGLEGTFTFSLAVEVE